MVNIEEIQYRLSEIREALEYLKTSQDAMVKSREKFLLGRYFLQIMLEAIFTIGNQIIADANLRKPGSYREILQILGENEIISEDLHLKLSPYAALRNRLVHTYWKISSNELLELCEDLSPFKEFMETVVRRIS